MMGQLSPTQRQRVVGFILVVLGAFGFSAKAILVKLAYAESGQVDAITLMALRMLCSLPFFLVVALWDNKKSAAQPLSAKQWLIITVLGMMGYYIASYLDFLGLVHISAGLERVILYLYPTFVVLFSAIAEKRRVKAQTGIALALSYMGMLLVFIEQVSLSANHLWLGSALILASAIVFAGFTMGSGIMTHRIGSTRFTAYTMTVAGIATLVHFSLQNSVPLLALPSKVYGLVLIMAIFSTVLPAFFMNAGIRRIGAGSASIISTTGPIATLALAYLVLDEAVTLLQIIGTLLVLTGVYVLRRRP